MLGTEDGMRRAGGADDDVGAAGGVIELAVVDDFGDDRALKLLGHAAGALGRAIRDENGSGALLHEVARGDLAHFARADEEDGAALERAEDFAGEIDGHGRDGDGIGADTGFAARFFGGGKGSLEQVLELAGNGSGGARDGEGLFDLAENLRLADDHRVEARGHAEEMADGLFVAVLVEVGCENGCVDSELAGEKCGNGHAVTFDGSKQFDAVAGGDDHALGDPGRGGEGARGFGKLVAADGDLLAQRNGRRFVVHADECKRHWGPNLCTWLKKLAAQTAIITTSAAPET